MMLSSLSASAFRWVSHRTTQAQTNPPHPVLPMKHITVLPQTRVTVFRISSAVLVSRRTARQHYIASINPTVHTHVTQGASMSSAVSPIDVSVQVHPFQRRHDFADVEASLFFRKGSFRNIPVFRRF